MKTAGFKWANPLLKKLHISLRVRNFESQKLKVNDNEGNPIEIAAVVVWRVVETAEVAQKLKTEVQDRLARAGAIIAARPCAA